MRSLAVAVALAAAALVLPSSAAAQVWTCEASAWAGSVLTSPREAPVTANAGLPGCRTAVAGPSAAALPLPLAASGMSAETRFDGAQQTAFAAGGVTDLRVRSLPALPIALPQPSFEDLQAVPLPAGLGTVDLRPALRALVPAQQLPGVDLFRVQGARAEATGRCVNGAVALTSAAAVSGVAINGTDVGAGQAHDQSVTLIDSQGIDPSDVDVTLIVRPPGLPLVVLQAVIQPVLDALPTIAIPATVAQVRTTPGRRVEAPGRVTQTGMHVTVTIAGQNVADLVLGEATVGASQVTCPGGGVADLALACTTRRLVLMDVLRRGDRVRLLGAAARSLAGRRVAIRFTATGRTVARPRIGADGLFRASAPLPRAALRRTNRARYQAVLGSERSLRLKLSRRMVVTGTRASGGSVTIAGRVLGPLGRPARDVVVERRLSCGRFEVVRRFRPRRDGRFRIRVPGPEGSQAAVFRLRTQVRRNARSRSLFPTFTLPRFVDLS